MKKILFIFTGGTIGSTVGEKFICTDDKKVYLLIEGYKKRFGDIGPFDSVIPYTVLSENLQGKHISMLVETVKNNLNNGYCGIVITHGTDTLAYSASALGYAIGNNSIPICLVSANYPLEDVRSNGYYNLYGAINFIHRVGGNGVWVSYKNKDDYIKIHRGTRLCPHTCFSDSVFSVKDSYFGYFDKENFYRNPLYKELNDEISPISASLDERCVDVMKFSSYPGMIYPEIPSRVKYVIWESYHSGTIDTLSASAKEFFSMLKERNISVFLTGCNDGIQYESTSLYRSLGVVPLYSVSPVAAFSKLWFLASSGRNVREEIFCSLGGDIVV